MIVSSILVMALLRASPIQACYISMSKLYFDMIECQNAVI